MHTRVLYLFTACFFFLSGFVASKHLVSDGVFRLISSGHQIRRVLVRAERDNLKIALKTSTVKNDVSVTQTPAFYAPFYHNRNGSAPDSAVIAVTHTTVLGNFACQSSSILNL